MKPRFLEITYRSGKPLAAYLYLPRQPGDVSSRTARADVGLVIDFAADDRPIGVEITAPARFTLAALNDALTKLQQAPATPDEVAPLLAAALALTPKE